MRKTYSSVGARNPPSFNVHSLIEGNTDSIEDITFNTLPLNTMSTNPPVNVGDTTPVDVSLIKQQESSGTQPPENTLFIGQVSMPTFSPSSMVTPPTSSSTKNPKSSLFGLANTATVSGATPSHPPPPSDAGKPTINLGDLYSSQIFEEDEDFPDATYDLSVVDEAGGRPNFQVAMGRFLKLSHIAGIYISSQMVNYLFYEFQERNVILTDDTMKAILLTLAVERTCSSQKTVEDLTVSLTKETANLKKVSNAIIETKREMLDEAKLVLAEIKQEAKKSMKEIIELGMSTAGEDSTAIQQPIVSNVAVPKGQGTDLLAMVKAYARTPPVSGGNTSHVYTHTTPITPVTPSSIINPPAAPTQPKPVSDLEAQIKKMLAAPRPTISTPVNPWMLTPTDGKKVGAQDIEKVDMRYLPLTNDTPAFLGKFRTLWCKEFSVSDILIARAVQSGLTYKEKVLIFYDKVRDEDMGLLRDKFFTQLLEGMKVSGHVAQQVS